MPELRRPVEPVDLSAPVDAVCAALMLDPTYVARITIEPADVRVLVYRGRDGLCEGQPYIDEETGDPAMTELSYGATTSRAGRLDAPMDVVDPDAPTGTAATFVVAAFVAFAVALALCAWVVA